MASENTSVIDRVQDWVTQHKRAVLIGTAAAVIAAGGVAYYASTSRPRPTDVEKAQKKKKSKGKKKSVKDTDGPILEERKAKVEQEVENLEAAPVDSQLAAMSTQEKTDLAASYKKRGNEAYTQHRFGEAAELYTRAIYVSPIPQPVYYSNRAACYINMVPPKNDLVIADCDEALKLDPKYVKALNRRANALEKTGRRIEALRDYSAAAILDNFQTASTAQAMERVLNDLAKDKATEIIANREPKLPSHSFTAAYFAAFRPRAHPLLPETPSQGDETLALALQALEAADYIHSATFLNEAIDQGISTKEGQAEALNLRGTFKFLMGDVSGAKADLEESTKLIPSLTQSLVKIASVLMEQGEPEKAFQCFEDAIQHNPNDPDIYYHRGQVLYIMNKFEEAAENYTKSIELDDQFVFSFIQLAVAQYRKGDTGKSTATFRKVLKAFPDRSEPHNYYGELLLDQGLFSEAVEKFDRAFELEKSKPRPNVLPLVNKALAVYQWKQDIGAAERCCNEALRIDPECEAAVATVAQLYLQQRKVEKAIEMFEKHIEIARSEPELINALTCKYATEARWDFMRNYPDVEPSPLAPGMM